MLLAQTLLVCPVLCAWASVPDREYQVKAAFLFNFTQYVQWPQSSFPAPDAPLVMGVLGPDPFSDYLDDVVRGEKASTHPIIVKRFQKLEDVKECHILYVGVGNLKPQTITKALNDRGILTVGDTPGFSEHGGMIGFVTRQGKIRFQVNLGMVQAAELAVSSKMLRLAEIIGAKEE